MNSVSINGVTIRTDKPGLSMNGEVIVFSDGSTYNTRTGAFNNAGPGDVYVNGKLLENSAGSNSARAESPRVVKSRDFAASKLSLNLRTAQVNVVTHDRRDSVIEIHGRSNVVEAVALELSGDTLIVTEHSSGAGSNDVVVIGNGTFMSSTFGSMSFGGGSVSIGGSGGSVSSNDPLVIKVYVPLHAPIRVDSSGVASVDIDGVDGSLDLKTSGASRVKSSGASDTVRARLSGATSVNIDGGTLSLLDVDTSGSSSLRFMGTATRAVLDSSGASSINVARVIDRPNKHSSGASSIWIGQIG